jgi:hypothetical protein
MSLYEIDSAACVIKDIPRLFGMNVTLTMEKRIHGYRE